MKSIEVQSEIGFADGEILGYERIGSALVVRVRAWNSKNLRVEFRDVQLMLDLMPGDISGFYRYDEETELLRKALDYAYDEPPEQHPYKHFAFMNTDGEPCLEIVAAETGVIVE
jgi:hypothetical protein